jgi:hypothetical protein
VKGTVNSFGLDAAVRVRGSGSSRISHVKVYMTACVTLGKRVVSYTSIGFLSKLFVCAL